MVPLTAIILLGTARHHVRSYLTNEAKGTFYVDHSLHIIDNVMIGHGEIKESLFPLRNFEKRYTNDKTKWHLSQEEMEKLFHGLDCVIATIALTVICVSLDHLVHCSLVEKLENFTFHQSSLGSANPSTLEVFANTNAILADLIESLLSIEPNIADKFSKPSIESAHSSLLQRQCHYPLESPPVSKCILLIVLQLVVAIVVLLKAYLLRFRDSVVGFYYRRMKWSRALRFYFDLLESRDQKLNALLETSRKNVNALRREALKNTLKNAKCFRNARERCHKMLISIRENFNIRKCLACERFCRRLEGCPMRKCEVELCLECIQDFQSVCPTCVVAEKNYRNFPRAQLSQFVRNRYGSITEEAFL